MYVDEAIWPYRGMMMCHLWSPDVGELRLMARRLGLRPEWEQQKPGFVHYDLSRNKRAQAVRLGAVPVTGREMARLALAARGVTP